MSKKNTVDLFSHDQVMSGTLTQDQLRKYRLDISHNIDYGNKCLGLDLVVRDTDGNVINVDQTGQ